MIFGTMLGIKKYLLGGILYDTTLFQKRSSILPDETTLPDELPLLEPLLVEPLLDEPLPSSDESLEPE